LFVCILGGLLWGFSKTANDSRRPRREERDGTAFRRIDLIGTAGLQISLGCSCIFFSFFLIILAFSLFCCRIEVYSVLDYGSTLGANILSCRPAGSVTAPSPPSARTHRAKETKRNTQNKGNKTQASTTTKQNMHHNTTGKTPRKVQEEGARSPRITTPHAPPPHPPPPRPPPPLLLVLAIPTLLHRGSRSSNVGTPQEVEHRRAAPLVRQESPTRHFRFALLVASLTLVHSSACWSFHLEQCLNKWSLVC